ncbi:MAG: glycosyltransferase [bacterium]|nr:glycosyltransferase [bacterium]
MYGRAAALCQWEPMRIAIFDRTGWADAARRGGHEVIPLPRHNETTVFQETLDDRISHGRRVFALLQDQPLDFIFDPNGEGMLFVDDPRSAGMDALLHHRLNVPLVSHFAETLRILFRRIDPVLVHQALQSPTWHKAIFTRGHLEEMRWMGVPNCRYLPLAAENFPDHVRTDELDPSGPQVLFAGSQQSLYFAHPDGVDTRTQVSGGWAAAAVADGSASQFLDAYRTYALGPCPAETDDLTARAECIRRYYEQKMFYSAWRNLGLRDRFVVFLKRRMGDDFRLVRDQRWRTIYDLPVEPEVDNATYYRMIRTTPICLNVINGDNETGLNRRPFEITWAGGFLLSYDQPELGELFEIGKECAVFRNERELVDQINYYLAHPEERAAIARAGQQRTHHAHLLHHRLDIIGDWLSGSGTRRGAQLAATS